MRSATPTLLVIGADEFAPDRNRPDPKMPLVAADVVRKIYNIPTFSTVGYASPAAADWFSGNLPAGFVRVDAVTSRVVTVGGLKVAVILFPKPDASPKTPTDVKTPQLDTDSPVHAPIPAGLLDAIGQAARAAKADLVIGVSPWGFQREARALPHLSGAVDILLGAGDGAPFPVEQTSFAPNVLWSRADRDGRCMTEFQIMALPDRTRPRPLLRDVDYTVKEHRLGMTVPSDPSVVELLGARPLLKK